MLMWRMYLYTAISEESPSPYYIDIPMKIIQVGAKLWCKISHVMSRRFSKKVNSIQQSHAVKTTDWAISLQKNSITSYLRKTVTIVVFSSDLPWLLKARVVRLLPQ